MTVKSTSEFFDTLIVPGFHGSGEDHWQTWFEQQLPHARRVDGIEWESPQVKVWSEQIIRVLESTSQPIWIVAHSFGSLATVWASQHVAHKIAGVFLVAPADPWRFAEQGLYEQVNQTVSEPSIAEFIPKNALPFPSIVIASTNDPWVKLTTAGFWAQHWGSYFLNIGDAGHINVESGFGSWPEGLDLLREFQAIHSELPQGSVDVEATENPPQPLKTLLPKWQKFEPIAQEA